MKDIVKPIAVLAAICLVVTALLAAVNSLTSPIIAEANEKAKSEAMKEVLSEADGFDELKIDLPDGVTEAYKASNGAGYVFMINAKGYGGTISVMTGVDVNGVITGVKVLSHSETSSYGGKAIKNDFTDEYTGKPVQVFVKGKNIDGWTGATRTTNGVAQAVNAACEKYNALKGGE